MAARLNFQNAICALNTMYLLYFAALSAIVLCCFYALGSRLKRPTQPIATSPEKTPTTTDSDSDSETNVIIVSNDTPSQLHALVIGINDYPNLPPLAGAVSDADSVTEYLTKDLGVPPAQITNLRNSSASRAGIIQGFQALRNNDQIERGSPILIYFAGHGGVETATDDWKKKYGVAGKVQVIFPFDYDEECQGTKVNCIPDKTIAGLLNQLAKAKGDNITVIFDSCHSASGNRGSGGRQARSAKVKLAIPADIDDDIVPPLSSNSSSNNSSLSAARHTDPPFCTHQTSHIHFAACGSDEQAWEEDGLGAFTAALLQKIRTHGVDKITYENLMKELPWLSKQTPHCYGANKSRILFNARVPSRKIAYIPVIFDPVGRTLTLQAGAASGVTEDSVWEMRESAAEGDKGVVGRVKASRPSVSTTALTPESEGGDLFWTRCEAGNPWKDGKKKLYARLIKSKPGSELKVWFSPEAKQLIFPEHEGGTASKSGGGEPEVGYVHSAKEDADITVELYQPEGAGEGRHLGSASGSTSGPGSVPEVVFHLCNSDAKKYGIATLRQRKPARRADVETILFAAARWNWHLRHTNMKPAPTTQVEMELFKIAEKRLINGEYSETELEFIKDEERVDLSQTGVADFEVYEKDLHAVRLKSQIKVPLYARMFYFDMTTFSIHDLFGHSVSNSRLDPVVPPYGEFIIGDGSEGDAPLQFGLDPGETLDVGYMKVFWSTDPLELDYLAQDSAFEMRVGGHSRKVTKGQIGPVSEWGTVGLTLVQRAPTSGAM